jgi:hypothetical protein
MTTLREHIDAMIDLEQADPANENMKVFTVHGASGDRNEMGSPQITDYVGECGPFDLTPGEKYISVYVGN